MKKLILIDFSWLYNRYYYVAAYAKTQEKEKLNIEATLFKMLSQFLTILGNSYEEAHVFMAMDSPTSTLYNFQLFLGYKQNRNKEEKKEVYAYLTDIVKKLSKKLDKRRFSFIKARRYEADQLLAYIVKRYSNNYEIIIYSGDKDLLQLTAYPNVLISDKFEKGHFIVKTDEEIFQKFKNSKGEDFSRISTDKKDILKYRVLKGDASDNLSPIFPRIKDKEIQEIIKNYWIDEEELTEQRIKDILDDLRADNAALAEKLEVHKDTWLRNYKIMDLYHVEDIKMKKL